MNLHEQFYDLRTKVWDEFERVVRTGCDTLGEFPIVVGELQIRNKVIADTEEIIIRGIVKNENYNLHVGLEGIDLIVGTNKVKVKIFSYLTEEETIKEVEPDILNLQCLSTYLSGGFNVYDITKK